MVSLPNISLDHTSLPFDITPMTHPMLSDLYDPITWAILGPLAGFVAVGIVTVYLTRPQKTPKR